jgi:hypothetical protein
MSNSKSRFDVVIPNNNESEFIATAVHLGYKEIVFLSNNINYSKPAIGGIKIKSAYLIKDVSEIQKARSRFDYIFAVAERKFFESKADYIIGTEASDRKDSFHFKSTSLNQVHAELSKSNHLNIVFDFNVLISSPTSIMGKFFQNALLVKKYRLNYSIFSLAEQPILMRSRNILDALGVILKL